MKYSIIVPFWNSEKWIGRCIESVIPQNGDFELILVNDNSTDNGREIAESYYDSRIVLLDNEHLPGVSGARNTGIDHAKGEYITFLDADDELLDGFYEVWENTTNTVANIHQINHLRFYAAKGVVREKFINKGGWYDALNLPKAWFGVWNKLFFGEFIKGICFDETIQYGEDGLFVFECLAKDNRIHHADSKYKAMMHRFDNKESLSHIKTGPDLLKQVHTYEKFLLRQDNPEIRQAMCLHISELWSSKRFLKLLGKREV